MSNNVYANQADALEKSRQPRCECERCGTCHGLGRVYHECYDDPQDERCLDCDGSGYTYECERCEWDREQEQA